MTTQPPNPPRPSNPPNPPRPSNPPNPPGPMPPQEPPSGAAPPPRPQSSGVGAWVSEGWQVVSGNLGMSILMMLLPAVPSVVVGIIMVVAGAPAALSSGSNLGQALSAGSMIVGMLASMVLLIVVMPALYLGILACFWEAVKTGRLTFDRITSGLPMFGGAILMGLAFGFIGLVLGAVAGAVPVIGALVSFVVGFPLGAWVALSFYHMAVTNAGVGDALSVGWNQVLADFWTLTLMGFVVWLITLAGGIACGVGILIAAPVTYAAWAACYRDKVEAGR